MPTPETFDFLDCDGPGDEPEVVPMALLDTEASPFVSDVRTLASDFRHLDTLVRTAARAIAGSDEPAGSE